MEFETIEERKLLLEDDIVDALPNWEEMCVTAKDECIIFHQDAFGADYQEAEYRLLGQAIKFAGMKGVEIRIIGKNRETLKPNYKGE